MFLIIYGILKQQIPINPQLSQPVLGEHDIWLGFEAFINKTIIPSKDCTT